MNNRIFSGICPQGIVYADRSCEEAGDYKRIAFLPYDTLVLDIYPNCPWELRFSIISDAETIQKLKGKEFQISTSGQTVLLGGKYA